MPQVRIVYVKRIKILFHRWKEGVLAVTIYTIINALRTHGRDIKIRIRHSTTIPRASISNLNETSNAKLYIYNLILKERDPLLEFHCFRL